MDRLRLCRALEAQRAYCEARSPFCAAVLRELVSAPDASWLGRAEHAWRGRRFAVDWEAAHLLLAGLHCAALSGTAPELADLYPSCGGSGGEPRGAVLDFLERAPAAFWEKLRTATVQTNEVGRSVAWMVAAAKLFGDTPFHLVELGASAGLNLIGDHVAQDCRVVGAAAPAGWNRVHPVLTRTGLDLRPLRLSDPEDRLWLKACVWADDLPRLERLERAIETLLRMQPLLVRCSFAQAPAWLAAHRPPRPGCGLLVFNSIATVYLDDSDYGALSDAMARLLAHWDGRAAWVEYERPRDAPEAPLQLRVHRSERGRLESKVFASGAPRPVVLDLNEAWGSRGEAETAMR